MVVSCILEKQSRHFDGDGFRYSGFISTRRSTAVGSLYVLSGVFISGILTTQQTVLNTKDDNDESIDVRVDTQNDDNHVVVLYSSSKRLDFGGLRR